ncbi:ferredoxin [Kitasatospora sp. NPDC101155]|uniref:ferredoxin n=1 Tax=Kitasatospora sp. NPDC101155 TaxID=3364097 RepID=UPI003800A348
MTRILADRDRCIGAGNCARLAPDFFDQDDDGLVTLLATDPGPAAEQVRRASMTCPVKALSVSEEGPA